MAACPVACASACRMMPTVLCDCNLGLEQAAHLPRLHMLSSDSRVLKPFRNVQVVNELCKQDAPRDSCIAVLPLGTANDLATSLGIPSDDLVKAMQIAVAGELNMTVPSTFHAFC